MDTIKNYSIIKTMEVMKEIVLSEYQSHGESDVEAFIDSYTKLRYQELLTHDEIDQKYIWVKENPYHFPNDNDCLTYFEGQYINVFVIEDVENWFNTKGRGIDESGKGTNQDVFDVFDSKCNKKWGNCVGIHPIEIGPIKEYHGVQYVEIHWLFYMTPTYLIKVEDKVFSIWY